MKELISDGDKHEKEIVQLGSLRTVVYTLSQSIHLVFRNI